MRTTNASSSIRFDYNQHGNVASESVTVFPHLTYHRAHAFTLVERLKPSTCRKTNQNKENAQILKKFNQR